MERDARVESNDNQGVRYGLLAACLTRQRLKDAARLFRKYDECSCNTVFAWGRVLERLLSEDAAGAISALKVARKQNPYAEAYLTGQRRLPTNLPGGYTLGSQEEATCFAKTLRMAWKPHCTALQWLADQAAPASQKRRKPKGA